MRDPVSGFEYPDTWVQTCKSPDEIKLVEKGYAVLTSTGDILRRGFTTGTTAAAAAKAAILSLKGPLSGTIQIVTPSGIMVEVPVTGSDGLGICAKYSGDYPSDVTSGAIFEAEASPDPSVPGITFTTGTGVGIWTRDNPRYRKGTPAISTSAHREIMDAISEAMTETGISGIRIRLSVIEGDRIAKKTLNERVGVSNGISVLGSTGMVEPWDDHLEESTLDQVRRSDHPVLTTGRIGMRYARMLFPERQIILVGSKIGSALSVTGGETIICGLPALILKYINPSFLDGTGFQTVEEMISSPIFHTRMDE